MIDYDLGYYYSKEWLKNERIKVLVHIVNNLKIEILKLSFRLSKPSSFVLFI